MSRAFELTPVFERLVDLNTCLHRATDLAASERLELMIRLREALRDLCVAAGAWEPEMELMHLADVAGLRRLSSGQVVAPGT
jgi:hypothetical protein